MKVLILKTGKTEEYDTGYAVRLVEQGKAVPAPEAKDTKGKPKAGDKAGA